MYLGGGPIAWVTVLRAMMGRQVHVGQAAAARAVALSDI